MTDQLPSPCCAHLTVLWATKRVGRGGTTGWWACADCGCKFYPVLPNIQPEHEPKAEVIPEGRLIAAARDFCKEETAIRAARRDLRPCTEASTGEPEIGDFGVGLCEGEPRCANCQAKEDGKALYRGSLRKRYLAKQRMLRAYHAEERSHD